MRTPCPGVVAWGILYGRSSDDHTHVCADHLSKMLDNVFTQAQQNSMTPTISKPSKGEQAELKCCFIEANAEVEALFLRITKLENKIEQLQVQAAGVGVAASGYIKGEYACKYGQYGWSRGYDDVKKLYRKYEQAYKALKKIEEIAVEGYPEIALRVQEGLKPLEGADA